MLADAMAPDSAALTRALEKVRDEMPLMERGGMDVGKGFGEWWESTTFSSQDAWKKEYTTTKVFRSMRAELEALRIDSHSVMEQVGLDYEELQTLYNAVYAQRSGREPMMQGVLGPTYNPDRRGTYNQIGREGDPLNAEVKKRFSDLLTEIAKGNIEVEREIAQGGTAISRSFATVGQLLASASSEIEWDSLFEGAREIDFSSLFGGATPQSMVDGLNAKLREARLEVENLIDNPKAREKLTTSFETLGRRMKRLFRLSGEAAAPGDMGGLLGGLYGLGILEGVNEEVTPLNEALGKAGTKAGNKYRVGFEASTQKWLEMMPKTSAFDDRWLAIGRSSRDKFMAGFGSFVTPDHSGGRQPEGRSSVTVNVTGDPRTVEGAVGAAIRRQQRQGGQSVHMPPFATAGSLMGAL
jgi:hypothetical protein